MISQSVFCRGAAFLNKRDAARATIGVLVHAVMIGAMTLATSPAQAQLTGTDLTLTSGTPNIYFNDNVGTNYSWAIAPFDLSFDIVDITNGSVAPFSIRPGAPQGSFFLQSSGDLGLGTFAPQKKLHLVNTDTPTIRLEQFGGEFGDHAYDIGQAEYGFFIRDVTGSVTPFFMEPAAPNDSLRIDNTGQVGLGTDNPAALIHGIKPAAAGGEILTRLSVSDDNVGRLDINNATATNGLFIPRLQGRSASQNAALIMEGLITTDTGSNPAIVYNAGKAASGGLTTRPLVVYRNNNVAKVTIAANGNITATAFNPVSSRALKDDIVDLDSAKATDALRQLTPVEYVYKDDETKEKRVGFIAEDVPEIVANADRQSVPIMDVVALVTKVVKDQQSTIEDQKQTIAQQKASIEAQARLLTEQTRSMEEMMKRLIAVERRIQD